jgi:hypothetical protein
MITNLVPILLLKL